MPCGYCLNCVNGFPQVCLKTKAPVGQYADTQNFCNDCEAPIAARMRFCASCRRKRRRRTWRTQKRRRLRCADV